MMRKVLDGILMGPYAVALTIAIAGAITALIGGLTGLDGVRDFGKSAAALGATGFFGWLFLQMVLPISEIGDVLDGSQGRKSKVAAQTNAAVPVKKDKE
jgi:ABC-type Co2+ transport system permease subunit